MLQGLRVWEICSPDVSAAIEYCREQIVDMPIDEYEDWFTENLPKVQRPKTAPAAMATGGRHGPKGRQDSKSRHPSSTSAPAATKTMM